MGRKKNREQRPRVSRSEAELLAQMRDELTTLRHLCDVYDGGHHAIATTMATVIQNVCGVGGAAARQDRAVLAFPTSSYPIIKDNLAPQHRLISASIGETTLTFIPLFQHGPWEPAFQAFQVWWHSEPIYVAGAGLPGLPLGTLPVGDAEVVPYDEREKLTRVQFIGDLRNALGAHPGRDLTAVLADVLDPHSFGGGFISEQADGSVLSSEDGTLPMLASPAAALTRQIAQELLIAYGLEPISSWVVTA